MSKIKKQKALDWFHKNNICGTTSWFNNNKDELNYSLTISQIIRLSNHLNKDNEK